MPYDDHRLAELRSLAYHQTVAERLRRRPELLARVRQRLETQRRTPRSVAEGHWAAVWLDVLARPFEDVLAILVERSEQADQLRQSTPFAGILTPRERWAIHRRVTAEWLEAHDDAGTA